MRSPLLKIVDVAKREYRATAMNRAFFFGVVLFPIIIWVVIGVVVPLFDSPDKRLEGTIGVLDQAGEDRPVATALEQYFDADRLQTEYDQKKAALEAKVASDETPIAVRMTTERALKKLPEGPHQVTVQRLADDVDLDEQKQRVRAGELLALIAVPDGVLEQGGAYDMFRGRTLDVELSGDLTRIIDRAIVDTRLAQAGLDAEEVRRLSAPPTTNSAIVTEKGETKGGEAAQFLLPMAFMMLLWIAAFTSGNYLLTTTIEEKSTRVMELLLSAVSPMQLMTGKIIGQALVGLTILAIYGALGIAAANQFNVLALVPTDKLPWLVIYFVMAYFLIGAFMAAIGSAVNELREAQSLMGVVMIILMIPLFLWMMIIRQPNSTFAVVASMIPPMTPFVMILRMAQTSEPVPVWQIVLATTIGFAAVVVAIWAAAKIFRVGVLMYGKPPTLGTLIKWIRYA